MSHFSHTNVQMRYNPIKCQCLLIKKVKVFIYDTVCFKNGLYEFGSALYVQILHYCCFTIQLVMLHVFNINLKNYALLTHQKVSKIPGFL